MKKSTLDPLRERNIKKRLDGNVDFCTDVWVLILLSLVFVSLIILPCCRSVVCALCVALHCFVDPVLFCNCFGNFFVHVIFPKIGYCIGH